MEDGIPVTTFQNKAHSARVELQHEPVAGWRGMLGVQDWALWLLTGRFVTDHSLASRTNLLLSLPMLYAMASANLGGDTSFGGFSISLSADNHVASRFSELSMLTGDGRVRT